MKGGDKTCKREKRGWEKHEEREQKRGKRGRDKGKENVTMKRRGKGRTEKRNNENGDAKEKK